MDEIAICRDRSLSRLDEEMAKAYLALRSRVSVAQRDELVNVQRSWLSSRRRCGSDRDCIESQYLERLDALRSGPVHSARFNDAAVVLRQPSVGAGNRIVLARSPGGTFEVTATINGILPLVFIVDSGATDVTLPSDVVSTLVRTGTLSEQDFMGEQSYRLADGTVIKSTRFKIRSMRVGTRTESQVEASIVDVNGPLLLGQSFLSRLRSWSINNATHELVLE